MNRVVIVAPFEGQRFRVSAVQLQVSAFTALAAGFYTLWRTQKKVKGKLKTMNALSRFGDKIFALKFLTRLTSGEMAACHAC